MSITGTKKEYTDSQSYSRKVGLFEAKVIAVNPDTEQYKELLGIEATDKALEYLGTSRDENTFLRIDIWLEEIKSLQRFRVTFFLENKERENKDFTKKQYINTIGTCAWADDPNNLPDWFKKREYRVAFTGEEEFYSFMRVWLGNLDYSKDVTTLDIDWKRLMKGSVKDVREQIDGEWSTNVVALATISVKEKDGEIKEYQGVYNKGFLPSYSLKQFRVVDYSDEKVLQTLKNKKPKDLKPHERFVLNVTNPEYGCREYFILKDLQEYNPEDNIVASDKPINEEDSSY